MVDRLTGHHVTPQGHAVPPPWGFGLRTLIAYRASVKLGPPPRRRLRRRVHRRAACRSPPRHTGTLPFTGRVAGRRPRLWTTALRLRDGRGKPLTLAGSDGDGVERECYVHNLWIDLWNICTARARGASGE